MNLEHIINEKGGKNFFNKYIVELTDEIAKKINGIDNIESKDEVGIYIGNILFYLRPRNFKEIENNLLNTLLDNFLENKNEEEYFSGLYNLYLLLQKYPDGNNRVGLLLKMILNKNNYLDKHIKSFVNDKNLPPKLKILIDGIENFTTFFIKSKLTDHFGNLKSFDLKSFDLKYINNILFEFNKSLDIKTPENVLEKLSIIFKLDLDIVKKEFIYFMTLNQKDFMNN